MRPIVGLRVIRDITSGGPFCNGIANNQTHDGGSSTSGNAPSGGRLIGLGSTSMSRTTPQLALGLVAKVTDQYIEIKWPRDGHKSEKIQAKDDGTFGLRVFDNPSVEHANKKCSNCSDSHLKGFTWSCQMCTNCLLCTKCYMANAHPQMQHWFLRFHDSTHGDPMPVRNEYYRARILLPDGTTRDVLLDHLPALSLCHEAPPVPAVPGTVGSTSSDTPPMSTAVVTGDLLGIGPTSADDQAVSSSSSSCQPSAVTFSQDVSISGCSTSPSSSSSTRLCPIISPETSSASFPTSTSGDKRAPHPSARPAFPARPTAPPRPANWLPTRAGPAPPETAPRAASISSQEDDGSSGGADSSSATPSGTSTPQLLTTPMSSAAVLFSRSSSVDDALTCPVCFERYAVDDDAAGGSYAAEDAGLLTRSGDAGSSASPGPPKLSESKIPLILTRCGHTLCASCAGRLLASSLPPHESAVVCPVCRAVTELRTRDVEELNRNYSLMNILHQQRVQMEHLQHSVVGIGFRRIGRSKSSSCLLSSAEEETPASSNQHGSNESGAAGAAGVQDKVAAETAALVAMAATAAAAGPKVFRGVCHHHARNLCLWCAVCCEILCLGCVDAHSGHDRLTAEELPAFLRDKMAAVAPQITESTDALHATTSKMLSTVDKIIREMKDAKNYWREETRSVDDQKLSVEEYRRSLSDLDLEDMINAWRRADNLVGEIRAKSYLADHLKKELDKDLANWFRKKPKFLNVRMDSSSRSPTSQQRTAHQSSSGRANATPPILPFVGSGKRRTAKDKGAAGAGAGGSGHHQHHGDPHQLSAAGTRSPATGRIMADQQPSHSGRDKSKIPTARNLLGRFFSAANN